MQGRVTARQDVLSGATFLEQVQHHEEELHQARRERLMLPADPIKALHMKHAPGIKLQLLAMLETYAVESISGNNLDVAGGGGSGGDRGMDMIARKLTQSVLSRSTTGTPVTQYIAGGKRGSTSASSPSKVAKPKGNPYVNHRYMLCV